MAGGLPAFPFPQEAILAQAQGNATALILGAIAYANAQGHDSHHWAAFFGAAAVPTWTHITTPREAATEIALECASAGMPVVHALSTGGVSEVARSRPIAICP